MPGSSWGQDMAKHPPDLLRVVRSAFSNPNPSKAPLSSPLAAAAAGHWHTLVTEHLLLGRELKFQKRHSHVGRPVAGDGKLGITGGDEAGLVDVCRPLLLNSGPLGTEQLQNPGLPSDVP